MVIHVRMTPDLWKRANNLINSSLEKTLFLYRLKKDFSPINARSEQTLLQHYSRAYLRYLLSINEGLGFRLASLNNLEFYLFLMKIIRKAIRMEKL